MFCQKQKKKMFVLAWISISMHAIPVIASRSEISVFHMAFPCLCFLFLSKYQNQTANTIYSHHKSPTTSETQRIAALLCLLPGA
jgi:hypothetical protein